MEEEKLFHDPQNVPLAMSYTPIQLWQQLYDPADGFARGTIFMQLDLPFIGEEAVPRD
jgi:hypothetical protein